MFFPGRSVPICSEAVLICSGLFPICSDTEQKNEYSNMHSNGAPVRGAVFFILIYRFGRWNMENNRLFSIGIDIGTSTFQMVISELTVENSMPSYVIPKFQITDKKIIYRSGIYFTPMLNGELLDMTEIKKLLETELTKSGIAKKQIESGAIIVTGEAANKTNADIAAQQLAEFAGDFVVAVAGPDLEASLAGYGSGAALISRKEQVTLVNLDIGGGTTNAAVFQDGIRKDQYALHVGGRLIRLNDKNQVTYISKKILPLLKEKEIFINVGQKISFRQVQQVCRALAEVLILVILGKELSPGQKALQIYHGNQKTEIDGCTVSGGVGELLDKKNPESLEETEIYGDIGPCLAAELKKLLEEAKIKNFCCPEKIQATVIGAGMHSMQLSGSTICYDKELLPLKNRPVVVMETDLFSEDEESVIKEMERKATLYQETVAFYFEGKKAPSYKEIKQAACILWDFYQQRKMPIILIFQQDMAKAMGQTLRILSKHQRKLLCIDSVEVSDGDYIDFCKAVGETILVTVKTLLYKN